MTIGFGDEFTSGKRDGNRQFVIVDVGSGPYFFASRVLEMPDGEGLSIPGTLQAEDIVTRGGNWDIERIIAALARVNPELTQAMEKGLRETARQRPRTLSK